MRLKGKTALVTGSASGIGFSISKMFLEEGANVCAGVRKEEEISETESGLPGAFVVKMDVSNGKEVEAAVSSCVKKFGSVDILVNNAGVYKAGVFHESPEKDWDLVIDIDLKGTYRCTKAVVPHMLRKKKGKIINIASIAGITGFAGSSAYCAAKGALVNLTRELALEYGPQKINVNCICPGVIKTKMIDPILADSKMEAGLRAAIPYPRFGEPSDIAYLATYLASDESDFMTGSIISIDGGHTA